MPWPWLRRVWLTGALLPALALPVLAHAQMESREAIALQNQLYQLRQELQVLRNEADRGYGGGGGGGSVGGGGEIAAQLLSRVQAMEEQVRQLRGRIDETQNMVTRQNADLSKRIDDLTFQLNLGKGGVSTSANQAPMPAPPRAPEPKPAPDSTRVSEPRQEPPTKLSMTPSLPSVVPPPRSPPPQSFTFNQVPDQQPRTDPTRPVPRVADATPRPIPPRPDADEKPVTDVSAAIPPGGKRTPELALQEGHAALARRDYPAAERSAREVMANRASPRAYDGQFLLAQSLSGEKQYSQAAIAFDDAYNRSHKGRYAQESLVGLAGALSAINEKKAACDTLGRLRAEFPEVRADLKDTITRTNERAGCGK